MTGFEVFMYAAFCLAFVFEDIRLLKKAKEVSTSQILTYAGMFIGFTIGAIGKVATNADWTTVFFLLGFALSGIALELSFCIRRSVNE